MEGIYLNIESSWTYFKSIKAFILENTFTNTKCDDCGGCLKAYIAQVCFITEDKNYQFYPTKLCKKCYIIGKTNGLRGELLKTKSNRLSLFTCSFTNKKYPKELIRSKQFVNMKYISEIYN